MYGGSNEVFGKNENFPLVLDIKLHLKMPVNYQLQISPPPLLKHIVLWLTMINSPLDDFSNLVSGGGRVGGE